MEEERNYSQESGNAYYSSEQIPYYSGGEMGEMGEKSYSTGKGMLGALLGVAIGIALWCLAGLIGYTIPYLAIIMGAAIIGCFMKFAGDIDAAGIIICAIFLLLGNYVGLHMCYAVTFYDWRPDMMGCIMNLYTYLHQYDMIGSFIKSLVISYVCAFAGLFGILKKAR